MKVQYYTATSLDGFIADSQHSLEWLFQFKEPEAGDYESFIRDIRAVVMGSSTYEWLLRHHVRPGEPDAKGWPYDLPSWIFSSRTLPVVDGADLRFVSGDVRTVFPEIRAAAGEGNVWVVGGGDLAGQFHDAGLLDELIVTIASVTLGAGFPLLPRAIIRPPLRLRSVKQAGTSFVTLVYDVVRPEAV